jgi:hypothetical protein
MSVSEEQLLAALRQIQNSPAAQNRETASQWRRANARIAAAMRASLEQQRGPRPPPSAHG